LETREEIQSRESIRTPRYLAAQYARYGFIVDVIVDERHQRKGVGKGIMHRILEKCHELELDSVNLCPTDGKIPFYESLGFVPQGEKMPLMRLTVT